MEPDELEAITGDYRKIYEQQAAEMAKLEEELSTEAELRHRYEKLAFQNAMECDALRDQLAEKTQSHMELYETFNSLFKDAKRLADEHCESLLREEAAVNDLEIACKIGEVCATCANARESGDNFPCAVNREWCGGRKWKWRGPRAEKGEKE